MTVSYEWRGEFTSTEANALHAECSGHPVLGDDEWDWRGEGSLSADHLARGPQVPSQASTKGLEGPDRRLRTRVVAPQDVNELLPCRRTSLPRRGIPQPANRAERITLAVELEHERRQVGDTQLPRPGPWVDRGIREPTKTLKSLERRGTGRLPESHEEVAGRTAHQLASRVPGHGEEGLVDVEDPAICKPDDTS
jgi:hypothetical protein